MIYPVHVLMMSANQQLTSNYLQYLLTENKTTGMMIKFDYFADVYQYFVEVNIVIFYNVVEDF